jgi:hypothetical protein
MNNQKRYMVWIVGSLMLLISACNPGNPAGPGALPTAVETAFVAATATIAPTATEANTATPIPTPAPSPSATHEPPTPTPASSTLERFINSLETALINLDVEALAVLMSDPFAVGGWRSEWRTVAAQSAAAEIIAQHHPAGADPLFSDLSREQISALLDGQDPMQMMGPDVTVAAVVHGAGWGPAGDEEVILFIVENEGGTYSWQAFLYAPGSFNPESAGMEYPSLDTLVFTSTTSVSPDSRWTATIQQSEIVELADGWEFYNTLTVTDGTTNWEPAGGWRGYGLGVAYLDVYRWGADGRTLYFANNVLVDGCGLFANFTDLYRLDLETGAITELIPANSSRYLNLSPDESILASVSWDGNQLWLDLLNPETEVENRIPLTAEGESAQAGNLVWSPDGESALITVAYDPCLPDWSHSTLLVDMVDLTTSTLIDHDPRRFTISEWLTGEAALLLDKDGNRWQLQTPTGEVTRKP